MEAVLWAALDGAQLTLSVEEPDDECWPESADFFLRGLASLESGAPCGMQELLQACRAEELAAKAALVSEWVGAFVW